MDKQRNDLNALAVPFIKAWLSVINFKYEEPDEIDCSTLLTEWENMTIDKCDLDIITCMEKVKLKRVRTDRNEYVAKMAKDILTRKKEQLHGGSSYRCFADNADYIQLTDFIHVLADWFTKKFYRQYTLCLHGDGDVGKTQLALSLLSQSAHDL